MMTIDDPRLPLLGDALREAAAADLAHSKPRPKAQASRGQSLLPNARITGRARIATTLIAAALAIPAAALATGLLSPEKEVADSIAGTITFAGTEPTCTTIREGLEYECLVDHAQLINGEGVKPGDFLGVVLPSVDKTGAINGGCRSRDAEGTRWDCFLGEESVRQGILMPSALRQGPIPSLARP